MVSDCLSSEKPYAVVNTRGLPEDEFRSDFPTVRAATILTPTAEGIPALLRSVRDPAADSLACARAQLKAYLLGPDEPPSTVRFNKAVQDLQSRRWPIVRATEHSNSRSRTAGAGRAARTAGWTSQR